MQYRNIHPSGTALGICASILHTDLGNWSITITCIHLPDKPGQLNVSDISHNWVYLSWNKLPEEFPQQLYSVTCNGTSTNISTSFVKLPLNSSTVYSCTVMGVSETDTFTSLRSFEVIFISGKNHSR